MKKKDIKTYNNTFDVGDVVKHKAGIRAMVVVQAVQYDNQPFKYQCEYQAVNSLATREWFSEFTLEAWFAER